MYESSTIDYQGAQNAGHTLQRVDTTYSSALFIASTGHGAIGNVFATDVVTTVYPSGKVKKIHKDPDAGPGNGEPIFGNVKKELEYDWGQGAPGALLRETDTIYQWEINPAFVTAHIVDLPASVIVKDGSGNRVAETDYTYDEAAYLAALGVTTQHVAPPYGVRGNLTTVSHWLNTSNSFISSHTNWYDTGEVYQKIDPLGHTTTYSYDPAYVGGYVTETCSPATNGSSHCVSGTYDFITGVLTSLTNENATTQASGNTQGDAAHTSNYNYDIMSRITSAQAPPDSANSGARAQNRFSFSTPNVFPVSVQRTKSITNALSDSATSFFDGLGRGYKSQHAVPGNTATVDTTFDADGHVATVSNPYFSVSDPTYGITTSQYDALDRVTQVTKQDGSVSSVNYDVAVAIPGNCTDTVDEAGKQRRTCSDGLGRLVEVDEPNPGSQAVAAQAVITISGALDSQARVGAVNAAAGGSSLTITGVGGLNVDQSKSVLGPKYCAQYNIHGTCVDWEFEQDTIFDAGTVTVTVNGHATSVPYGSGSSTNTIASGLVTAINNDTAAFVNASSSGAVLTFSARATGAATNYSWSVSGVSSDSTDFGTAGSFFGSPASGALTGGLNGFGGTTVYDAGTVTLTIGSFTASAMYGQSSNSTAAQIATALAGSGATGLNRAGSPVSAVANGASITLTYATAGASGDGVTVAASSQSTQTQWTFSPASFTGVGSSFGNGLNAGDLSNTPFITQYQYDTLGNLLRVDQKGTAPGDSTQWRTRTFTYDSLSRLLTATNPESGTISYVYDADGSLLQKTSPAPNQTGAATQTVSYCYDALHRVAGKGYGAQSCPLASAVVSYVYDSGANAVGKLVSLTDQAGSASYSYDPMGRMTAETRTLIGAGTPPPGTDGVFITKTLSYEYNLDGSLKTLHYPSGAAVTYTPDSAGRILSAVDSSNGVNYATGATYGPDGALTGFVSGYSSSFAGITNAFAYNKRLQPLAMSATAPSQTVYSIGYDFHYGAGNNGNVFGIYSSRDTHNDKR
ncbi:MAG TPA: hypothetical protein VHA06_24000 [Candidatus Angelobacter sp.]|nr:hypothetical protein [Candidatus Angelobacter sp.]